MGNTSSIPKNHITVRPTSPITSAGGGDADDPGEAPAGGAEAAAEGAEAEAEEAANVILLRTRWVRDRATNQEWIEKNRRRDDMLERRGEVTHALRDQGKRFFTRHKDGRMQMDPKTRREIAEAPVEAPAEEVKDGVAVADGAATAPVAA